MLKRIWLMPVVVVDEAIGDELPPHPGLGERADAEREVAANPMAVAGEEGVGQPDRRVDEDQDDDRAARPTDDETGLLLAIIVPIVDAHSGASTPRRPGRSCASARRCAARRPIAS